MPKQCGLCQLKLQTWKCVVTTCTDALKIDSNNVKALYRRGVARRQMQQWDEAKTDLESALEVEPKNKEVEQTLLEVREALEMAKKKKAEMDQNDYSRFDEIECSD